MEEPSAAHFGRPDDDTPYRAVSAWAVVALLSSPVAFVALVDPRAWWLPAVCAGLAIWALDRVRRGAGELLGRKAALTALGLSIFSLAAAVSMTTLREFRVTREADQWAQRWFDLMRRNAPAEAYQLHVEPRSRQEFSAGLWDFYRTRPIQAKSLRSFVAGQPMRALLELGERAEIRPCGTERYVHGELPDERRGDLVVRVYAISYGEGSERQTFLMRLLLARVLLDPQTGESGWQILGAIPGIADRAA